MDPISELDQLLPRKPEAYQAPVPTSPLPPPKVERKKPGTGIATIFTTSSIMHIFPEDSQIAIFQDGSIMKMPSAGTIHRIAGEHSAGVAFSFDQNTLVWKADYDGFAKIILGRRFGNRIIETPLHGSFSGVFDVTKQQGNLTDFLTQGESFEFEVDGKKFESGIWKFKPDTSRPPSVNYINFNQQVFNITIHGHWEIPNIKLIVKDGGTERYESIPTSESVSASWISDPSVVSAYSEVNSPEIAIKNQDGLQSATITKILSNVPIFVELAERATILTTTNEDGEATVKIDRKLFDSEKISFKVKYFDPRSGELILLKEGSLSLDN